MLSHKNLSYAKSLIRIVGFLTLFYSLGWAILILIFAEAVGMVEEVYA